MAVHLNTQEQFQTLVYNQYETANAIVQTQFDAYFSETPHQHCKCLQISPNSTKLTTSTPVKIKNSQQENQQESDDKLVRKLQFQVSKLKMQITLLKLKNQALARSQYVKKDDYYEQVINKMQEKIEQLMQQNEKSR